MILNLCAAGLVLWLFIWSVLRLISRSERKGREMALKEVEHNAMEKAVRALEVDSLPLPADKSVIIDGLRDDKS